jgi:hypothetical protein
LSLLSSFVWLLLLLLQLLRLLPLPCPHNPSNLPPGCCLVAICCSCYACYASVGAKV